MEEVIGIGIGIGRDVFPWLRSGERKAAQEHKQRQYAET
ncbi:MAG: hypothetical protein ETSY2_09090 [Candidatus Entotheonella gemina]|uniref:Uncharacterized protein n=1 Tax=Candidatus Entotheonella gemina TaxID=1429439 RepID=W4MDW7_9BACT|nr:MAG: hypothetical protein ETSY2_09090 [Candidatus Entotheonella gemina]